MGSASGYQHELLDEWCGAAMVAWLRSHPGDAAEAAAFLPGAMLALLDAAAAGGAVLAAAVDCRLAGELHATLKKDLGAEAERALRDAPRFEGEDDLLRQLQDTVSVDERAISSSPPGGPSCRAWGGAAPSLSRRSWSSPAFPPCDAELTSTWQGLDRA